MSCDRHTDAIVDHACGADIAAEAAAHLDGCTACRRMFDEQLRLVRDLDGQMALALEIEPSPRFVPEARARVERAALGRRTTMWWGGAAAAAAVLMLVTFGSLRSGEQQGEEQPAAAVASIVPAPVAEPHGAADDAVGESRGDVPADRFAPARASPAGHRGLAEPDRHRRRRSGFRVAGTCALPGPRARWRTRRVNAPQLGRDRCRSSH